MPKYKNVYKTKPEINQLIYWMGPQATDILGWYRGGHRFDEYERKYPGYIPKWWYPADSELNIKDPLDQTPPEPKKRGRKPKNEEQQKEIRVEKHQQPEILDNFNGGGDFF